MNLTQRIILLILVTITLSSLANFLLSEYQEESLHNDSEKLLARTVIHTLRDAVVQDVINGNRLRVTNLLASLKSNNNPIEFLYITDTRSGVFAHSFQQGFPRYLAQGEEGGHEHNEKLELSAKYQTEQGLVYVYSEPLIAGLDMSLHIGINQSEIAEKLAENKQRVLTMSAVIALLALLISYLWSKQITAPLARLTEQIQAFGAGDILNISREKKAPPEINLLATAFQMAIDEKHQILEALQEREQKLAITLDSIGDAVVATDAKGKITRMNPVAEQLTGWSLQEAKGTPLKEVFPIVDATTREPIENPIEKVLASGEIVYLSNHTTLISKSGAEYQIADSAAPIRDGENNIQGMVLVFNDVTEQYQLREARKESDERFRQLAENINEVFWLGSPDWDEIFYVSPAYEKIWGQNSESLYRHSYLWLEAVHPDDREQVMEDIPKDLSSIGEFVDFRKYRILRPDGEILWIKARAYPIRDEDGQVIRVAGIAENITEQIDMEETLRRTQKMDALGKLTGGIAHDYNNMLGVVLGYSDLLKDQLKDSPKLAKYIHEIHRAGERGANLTRKLLAFSRQKTIDAEQLNINLSLEDRRHMLEKILTARIKLVFELEDDLWPVWLDDGDLEDAIVNLSINAMHAIDGNGQLTIQTRNVSLSESDIKLFQMKSGDYVQLSINDSGRGMNETTKEKIFEPFFSTKGDKGTGLGLSQVYGFVEQSGGAIKVYTEPDHGTRMMLYFPRYQKAVSKNKVSEENTGINLGGHEKILIVDDEIALLDLTSEILETEGYNAICAENAKQALDILQHESIDLLLSDIIMPEIDGYQLAAEVREKYPTIKIQLASGFADDRHIDMVDEALHDRIIYKPYQAITLLKRIRDLLDENQSSLNT